VFFELHWGVWSLLIANALTALFLNVASLALIRRITRSGSWLRFTWDRRRLGRILNFGSWVFGASVLSAVINPLNRLFVTRFAGIAAVPVFDISYAMSFKVRSFFESGFRSLAPEFSRLNARHPEEAHRSLLAADRRGRKAVFYWGTLVYLVVFALCGRGLQFWLGTRSTPALPAVFRIMLVGTYLGLWGLQSWYSLLGFGRTRHIFLSIVAQAICNIAWVLLSPVILHRPATLPDIALGAGGGMLAATLYLRWQGAKLKEGLACRRYSTTVRIPVVKIQR
jgi:O-antigen/teichoic acid export membrane protein